jgi:hypothetical protein
VITGVTVSASRTEVGAGVQIDATVTDAESSTDALTFEWSADGGTFTGTGPRTTWNPPAGPTPATYKVTLTVVEKYPAVGSDGATVTAEHRIVAGSVAIRVHDSPAELGEMALRFYELFADSAQSPDACIVDFSDSCGGKADEHGDITDNREHYQILDSSFGAPRISYAPGDGTAEILVRAAITSRIIDCDDMPAPCSVGDLESVVFDGYLLAVYEDGRWWLCISNARPLGSPSPVMLRLLGVSRK